MTPWRHLWLGVVVALHCAAGAASASDPIRALDAGNQLAREGQWEDAISIYLEGWDPAAPHATLQTLLSWAQRLRRSFPESACQTLTV